MDAGQPALPQAPGSKASRICGILALVFNFTCIGIPVGFVLAIVGLVQHFKAKRLTRETPGAFALPSSAGLVLGIVGLAMPVVVLPFAGIVSAIAIPALLAQRTQARDTSAIATLNSKLPDLAERYGRALETGAGAMTIKRDLDAYLQGAGSQEKNPHNLQCPAFRFTVGMTTASTEEDMGSAARSQATTIGEVVFVMSAPVDPLAPRFVAGAVRTKIPRNGNSVSFNVIRVD